MNQLIQALLVMAVGVAVCALYFFLSNKILDIVFPASGQAAGRNIRISNSIRPWLFMGPALIVLGIYLVYPVFSSVWRSFFDSNGENFIGFSNYSWLVYDEKFRESFFNNMLWLAIVPTFATFFGLIIAALTDRIWWGSIAKSLIFLPMAISFVGASVIWKFVYDFRDSSSEQIGILNAIVVGIGGDPQPWMTIPFWNSILLMVILIWIQTGFAMVIFSAALRGIPEGTIEAAVLDGANPFQIFYRIRLPQIWKTVAVVWTTITILVLKVFDIVLAMTNGQWNTQVLANLMFNWMFSGNDAGRASTIALVIMILVIPIMAWNIRNAREN